MSDQSIVYDNPVVGEHEDPVEDPVQVQTATFDIAVWRCDRCGKLNHVKGNMMKHIGYKGCQGAELQELKGVVHVALDPCGTRPHQLDQQPPMKKVRRPHERVPPPSMDGRVPAFTEEGDDARIEYLFKSWPEFLEDLSRVSLTSVPAHLFKRLWVGEEGASFPTALQSLVKTGKGLIEVQAMNVDTQEATCITHTHIGKDLAKQASRYVLDFLEAVLMHSVPERCPHLQPRANAMLNQLQMPKGRNQLTLLEAVRAVSVIKLDDTLKAEVKSIYKEMHATMNQVFQ